MKLAEIADLVIATLVLTFVAGLAFIFTAQWENLALAFAFSVIIIAVTVMAKKSTAFLFDADIEHETWNVENRLIKEVAQKKWNIKSTFKKPWPAGILLPVILSIISLGTIKCMALLTYESRALKYRAAKRFGFYSYTEMTDVHNGLIGAAGIIALFIIAPVAYMLNFEYLTKIAIYYAFWNLLPISKLDGNQIFFGSRILWAILATITLIASAFVIVKL